MAAKKTPAKKPSTDKSAAASPMPVNMSPARKALFNACMDVLNYDTKTKGLSPGGVKVIQGKLAALEKTKELPMGVFDLGMMAMYLESRKLPKASEQVAEIARAAMGAQKAR